MNVPGRTTIVKREIDFILGRKSVSLDVNGVVKEGKVQRMGNEGRRRERWKGTHAELSRLLATAMDLESFAISMFCWISRCAMRLYT